MHLAARLFWWGNELEDFCTSFAGFGALAPLVLCLHFLGGLFPLIGWDGVDGVFALFLLSFFTLSLARQRGNAARAKLGGASYHAPEFSGD